MLTAMNAMTDVQLHRYNTSTVDKTKEQVDTLIARARSLLRADPQFKKLLADLARL